jgi:Flp pilus assembly protein TadB
MGSKNDASTHCSIASWRAGMKKLKTFLIALMIPLMLTVVTVGGVMAPVEEGWAGRNSERSERRERRQNRRSTRRAYAAGATRSHRRHRRSERYERRENRRDERSERRERRQTRRRVGRAAVAIGAAAVIGSAVHNNHRNNY